MRLRAKLSVKKKSLSKPIAAPIQTGTKKVASGFATARQNLAQQKVDRERRMNQPFRFRISIGEEAKLLILDKEPFFLYEHQWESKKGIWDKFDVCIKEKSKCPLCEKLGKDSSYVMMLTCIDFRPYTKHDGTEVKRSKKLLPIKTGMIPKYERIFKKHGTFRGVMINVTRDGAKAPNTGDSVEFVKILPEDSLAKYGDLANPVDYKKAFPFPTEEEMRKRYGVDDLPGSEDSRTSSSLDLDDDLDLEDDE